MWGGGGRRGGEIFSPRSLFLWMEYMMTHGWWPPMTHSSDSLFGKNVACEGRGTGPGMPAYSWKWDSETLAPFSKQHFQFSAQSFVLIFFLFAKTANFFAGGKFPKQVLLAGKIFSQANNILKIKTDTNILYIFIA